MWSKWVLRACLSLSKAAIASSHGLILAAILSFPGASAHAATRVGNGDDGADLESTRILEKGPIFEARAKAAERLRTLHVEGIYGMGQLIPEVESARLLQVKSDAPASNQQDQGAFHSDMRGLVFARTFPESHAPTRFFPIADKLSEDQLIALHIHEALHRALPQSVREDEGVVSTITMAVTSTDASHDRVRQTVAKYVPEERTRQVVATSDTIGTLTQTERYPIARDAAVLRPSMLAYSYRSFTPSPDIQVAKLQSMHVIQSFLYPFGSDDHPVGLGIEASVLNRETDSQMGPLSLSGRMRLWSSRGFDIGAWAVASLNTLSAAEVRNTAYGRDVLSIGLSMRKDIHFIFVENTVGLSMAGDSKQKIGSIDYNYEYGSVVTAAVRTGLKWKSLQIGGFAEMDLADYFRVKSDAFEFDSGRYYIVGAGPEIAWRFDAITLSIFGRFLVNSTKDANFDYLGNVMGQGIGQRSVGASLAVNL